MKSFLGILVFCLLSTYAFSQEKDYLSEMLAAHNGISQKEGTEELLKDLLGEYGKNRKEVIAILFSPQACPRCEVDINFVLENIGKVNPDAKVVVIASYPDAGMAKKYVKEKFDADALITDTTNLHDEIFYYRAGRLSVTYLLQIDARQGRLMCGGDSPNMSIDFLKQFCSNTDYMPFTKADEGENNKSNAYLQENRKKKGAYRAINIKQSEGFSVSSVLELPEWKGDAFLYADELLSKGLLFAINGDTAYFDKDIYPTKAQERAFSRIPAEKFHKMQQQGMIFIMANCVAFTPDTKEAMVSYSLPDLSYENGSSIAYYNKPVILETISGSDSCKMEVFDFEHDAEELYMYTHASKIIPLNERYVLIGCRKGFPTTCTAEDCRKDSSQNIFEQHFYNDTPICAIFDKTTGRLVKRFGHLDNVFKASKTGYFFTVPTADAYAEKIIYSDGCSGKLWVTKKGEVTTEREISLFSVSIPSQVMKSAEPLQYTDDYFNAFFEVFHKYIESIKADSKGIHCLVRNGSSAMKAENDTYEYHVLSYEGKTLGKYPLTLEEGDEVLSINLGKDKDNNVFLYYMCKNENEYYLKRVR